MTPTYATGPGFKTYDRPLPPTRLRRAALLCGLLCLVVLAAAFALPALGQDAAAPPADVAGDQLGELVQLALGVLAAPGVAKWIGLALVAVLAAVYGVRWVAKGRTSRWAVWIRSDEGGTVLGWLVSALGAFVVHLAGGGQLSLGAAAAVALGLRAGTSITWSDGRRLLRVLAPVIRLIPKVGAPLASIVDLLSGATAKAEIAAATAAAYKPLAPAPDAAGAAAILSKPPVP